MQLPTRQQQALDFIRAYIAENSYPPSTLDIARHLEITTTGAQEHVKALVRKGLITRVESIPRSIVVL